MRSRQLRLIARRTQLGSSCTSGDEWKDSIEFASCGWCGATACVIHMDGALFHGLFFAAVTDAMTAGESASNVPTALSWRAKDLGNKLPSCRRECFRDAEHSQEVRRRCSLSSALKLTYLLIQGLPLDSLGSPRARQAANQVAPSDLMPSCVPPQEALLPRTFSLRPLFAANHLTPRSTSTTHLHPAASRNTSKPQRSALASIPSKTRTATSPARTRTLAPLAVPPARRHSTLSAQRTASAPPTRLSAITIAAARIAVRRFTFTLGQG